MTAIGAAAQPVKNWTILYYFDGKNNLAPMAKHSFDSLAEVGSSDSVNLVAQYGLPKQDVQQGLIEKGRGVNDFTSIGDADMGDGANIQKFVEWGMQNYPAQHYALVLWDHGAGFEGSMSDEETKHLCSNNDLAKALEAAQKNSGKKLEVINFNACLMNQAETAYELRNSANYMVGSEEVEAGLRIPIPGVFGTTPQHKIAKDIEESVKTRGDLSGEELAKLIVFESKNQFGSTMFTPTQAAVDLSKAGALKDKLNNLAVALTDSIKQDPSLRDVLRSDIKKAQHFCAIDAYIEPYVDYRDVGDFARVIEKDKRFTDPRVAAAAAEVKAAMYDAVIAEWHATTSSMGGKSLEGATGLSVYLPRDYGFDKPGSSSVDNIPSGGTHGHENTSFAKDSKWDEMLKTIAVDDDFWGKFPKLNRALMPYGQLAGLEGYNYAWEAASGVTRATGFELWPLMGPPYILPIPSVVGAAAGAVGGALRVEKGLSSIAEGIRRDESQTDHRVALAVNGAIDAAIGAGSVATCVALIAGHGGAVAPIATGVLALGLGRIAVNAVRGYMKVHKADKMTVDQKLETMKDARPSFKLTSHPVASAPVSAPAAPPASNQPAKIAA